MKKADHIESKKQSRLSNFENAWILYGLPVLVNNKTSENKQIEDYQLMQLKNLTKMEIYLKR